MDRITLHHLAVWRHSPKGKPTARVILIHGISEHSGRHLNTIEALLESGCEVVRFDLRGAGESGGARQWIERFGDYVKDVTDVFHWVSRELEPLPLFVLGHSLGGMIATYFAGNYQSQLRGLILSAPAYFAGDAISKYLIAAGRIAVLITPKLRIPKTTKGNDLSRDPKVAEAYSVDPLACHFNTLRQGDEVLRAMEHMGEQAEKLRLPILVLHGTDDRICKMEGSFDMVRRVNSHDRTLHILPGGYHEPHNDIDKEEYFRIVTHWLARRIDGTTEKAPKSRKPREKKSSTPDSQPATVDDPQTKN